MSSAVLSADPAIACAVCGAGGLTEVRREAGGHALLGCPRCRVWSVFPPPSGSEIEHFYNAPYYEAWRRERGARERMWRRRLRLLDGLDRGRLLDVGCAEGDFLLAAREAGFEIEGTELSGHAAAEASAVTGALVHQGNLGDACLPAASFDVVTIWHVLEHILVPGDTLREARRLLVPGGRLLVAVPNRWNTLFSAFYRIARGRPLHLYDPGDREQHLHHWDPASLRAALEKHGFSVEWLRPDPCALGAAKQAVEIAGKVHSCLAGEPRTSAMVARARATEGRA